MEPAYFLRYFIIFITQWNKSLNIFTMMKVTPEGVLTGNFKSQAISLLRKSLRILVSIPLMGIFFVVYLMIARFLGGFWHGLFN